MAGTKQTAPGANASAVGALDADGTKLQQGRTEALGVAIHVVDVPASEETANADGTKIIQCRTKALGYDVNVGDVPSSDAVGKENFRSSSDIDDDPDFVIRTKKVQENKFYATGPAAPSFKKRAYRYISPVAKEKLQKKIIRPTWTQDMETLLSSTKAEISDLPCCYKYKCFSTVDKKQLRKKIQVMIGAPNSSNRTFLGSLYRTNHGGTFK